MEIRKVIFMVLCLFLAGYLCFEGAEGFNNASYGKYKTIIKKQREVEESDIEPARAVNPRRKASVAKRPWLTDTFLEMENLVFDPWDNVYSTMDWPKYAWPDGTRQNYRPDQYPDWSGCSISAPPYWDIQDRGNTYLVNINIIKGVIRAVQVKGPAKLGKIDNLQFPVHVYPNAANGTIVKVTLFTISVVAQGRYFGTCSTETKIENGECTCIGVPPSVYASSATIAPGGTDSLWVDSGGFACPPYTWTVSGTGYTLNKAVTENDLETVTLTSAAGVCGVAYGAYATMTVTDACNETVALSVRNTGGTWKSELGCRIFTSNPDGFHSAGAGLVTDTVIVQGQEHYSWLYQNTDAFGNEKDCAKNVPATSWAAWAGCYGFTSADYPYGSNPETGAGAWTCPPAGQPLYTDKTWQMLRVQYWGCP